MRLIRLRLAKDIEVTVDGTEPTVVFDRTEADVGEYRLVVGQAEQDEGNCQGIDATRYEVVLFGSSGLIDRVHSGALAQR